MFCKQLEQSSNNVNPFGIRSSEAEFFSSAFIRSASSREKKTKAEQRLAVTNPQERLIPVSTMMRLLCRVFWLLAHLFLIQSWNVVHDVKSGASAEDHVWSWEGPMVDTEAKRGRLDKVFKSGYLRYDTYVVESGIWTEGTVLLLGCVFIPSTLPQALRLLQSLVARSERKRSSLKQLVQ